MNKKIGIPVISYLLFSLELIWIYSGLSICPFEHEVDEIRIELVSEPAGQYEYQIENLGIDEEDIFRLVNISGWLIKLKEDGAEPIRANVILNSENKCYELETHSNRRPDLYQLGQINPEEGDLNAGFWGKYPAKCFDKGRYRLGFILKENGKQVVLWSDSVLDL